jgi:hypothetical protein
MVLPLKVLRVHVPGKAEQDIPVPCDVEMVLRTRYGEFKGSREKVISRMQSCSFSPLLRACFVSPWVLKLQGSSTTVLVLTAHLISFTCPKQRS